MRATTPVGARERGPGVGPTLPPEVQAPCLTVSVPQFPGSPKSVSGMRQLLNFALCFEEKGLHLYHREYANSLLLVIGWCWGGHIGLGRKLLHWMVWGQRSLHSSAMLGRSLSTLTVTLENGE